MEHGLNRGDIFLTLVYDAGLVIAAIGVRASMLWVLETVVPPGTENWAIRAISFISDVGLVAATALIAIFDFAKRVVVAWKLLLREIRSK